MTTVAVSGAVGCVDFTRPFSVTATDGQWNNVVSTLSSQALGLEIPFQKISHVQLGQATGIGVWRIQDSKTLVVKRQGMLNLVPNFNMAEAKIDPYVVQPADILQVYTQIVDSTSNQTNLIGHVYTSNGIEPFGATDVVDSTATAVTNIATAQTLGDWAFNSQLLGFSFQTELGAQLSSVEVIDQTGGTVATWYGNVRLPTAGGQYTTYNLKANAQIPIMKGFTMKVKTVTA